MDTKRCAIILLIFLCASTAPSLYAESLFEILQKASDPYAQPAEFREEIAGPAFHPKDMRKDTQKKERLFFLERIDRQLYAANKAKQDEKKLLREAWRAWLGIDIYFPYYKAREIEDWASDKLKMQVFKIRGRPKMENNQFRYIFSTTF